MNEEHLKSSFNCSSVPPTTLTCILHHKYTTVEEVTSSGLNMLRPVNNRLKQVAQQVVTCYWPDKCQTCCDRL